MSAKKKASKRIFSFFETVMMWTTGGGLVLLAGVLTGASVISDTETRFHSKASAIQDEIVEITGSLEPISTALVGVYQSGENFNASMMAGISEELIASYPYINFIAYEQWIRGEQRLNFEKEMRSEGIPDFKITQLSKAKKFETAPESAAYLPVKFIEKYTPYNVRYLGYDLLSDERLLKGFNKAMLTGKAVIISPFETPESTLCHMMLKATYYGHFIPETIEYRREQVDGAFLVSLNLDSILEELHTRYPGLELDINRPGSFQNNDKLNLHSEVNYQFFPENSTMLRMKKEIALKNSALMLTAAYSMGLKEMRLHIVGSAMFLAAMVVLTTALLVRGRKKALVAQQQIKEEMFKERERAEVTLKSIGDAVVTIDNNSVIQYMNPIAKKLISCNGWKNESRQLDEVISFIDEDTNDIITNPLILFRSWAEQNMSHKNVLLMKTEDQITAIEINASLLKDSVGNETGMVLVFRDLSIERELADELNYQATHDLLTGLMNRNTFKEKIKQAIESCRSRNTHHAICYLDLDQFKLINDTCGHTVGDELLKQMGSLLQSQLRDKDELARLGGDEFGILVPDCDLELAKNIATRLLDAIRTYRFEINDKTYEVSASIGVVPITEEIGNLSDVLNKADIACYMAKEEGRNTIHVYQGEDSEINKRQGEMQWLPRLQKALREDKFVLYLQTIQAIDSNDRPINLHEFLIRLKNDNGDLVPPGLFIPAAERYDMMRHLDRWVITHAFEFIHNHRNKLHSDESVFTINLSGQSLGDREMSDFVTTTLKNADIPAELICFEVTETAAITNYTYAMKFINRLRDFGCRFALDDFGSGLSSFGYLKQLPIDFLKIDGQFVKNMDQDPVDQAMVRTIVQIAGVLKIKTIAEFVENQAILDILQSMGTDYAQGYHIAKPKPAEEIATSGFKIVKRPADKRVPNLIRYKHNTGGDTQKYGNKLKSA